MNGYLVRYIEPRFVIIEDRKEALKHVLDEVSSGLARMWFCLLQIDIKGLQIRMFIFGSLKLALILTKMTIFDKVPRVVVFHQGLPKYSLRGSKYTFEPWHVISKMWHFDKCRLRRAYADSF